MSSSTSVRRGGGHFPVGGGRRRHVPVVDTGCGCRPRRPRVLLSLPSFLKPSSSTARSSATPSLHSSSSSFFFPSSSSTASFSSSSNCSNHYNSSSSHGYVAKVPPAAVKRQPPSMKKKTKRYYVVEEKNAAATEEEVGVAVEKESSDPRADFRESMAQMVVEAGLCGWDDLRCMLRRLLALNAPRHHAAILTAFAEVCAHLAAPPPPPPLPEPSYSYQNHC